MEGILPVAEDTDNASGGSADTEITERSPYGFKVYHKPLEQIEIKGIPPPPDHIFKFRKNREAPSNDVWGQGGSISYVPHHAEYIEGEGNFVYWYDTPFPSKTVAPVQAIYAIGTVKRAILTDLYLFQAILGTLPLRTKAGIVISLVIAGKKARGKMLNDYFTLFNEKHKVVLDNFFLEDGYYCKTIKEIRIFVQTVLTSFGVNEDVAIKTGEIIGCLFEYDNAYRSRIQDLLNEAIQLNLIYSLPTEMNRLLKIQSERETVKGGGEHVTSRLQSAVTMLKYMWRVPSIKRALQEGFEAMNLDNCKLDAMDIYHTCLYGDYDTNGKTLAERLKILEGYHGADQKLWPPRILIKSN